MSQFIGGCMCGAIRYKLQTEPRLAFLCQCRQCQRITGTGHSAEVVASEKDTAISGELKFYELTADSGNTVTSGFCPLAAIRF
ncbi:GFA family protein [Methylomonas sp. LL1]|uniref:GFA family protein n=1 Tax=Methylomonas sp. LL1 TaxID=2785785 RepID=UPI0018C407FD|nr:GFA family protein [Methylomonas sp. LL1]